MEPCGPPAIASTPVAKQPVCVTAKVTISPKVTSQPPTVVCVGPPRIVKWGDPPCADGVLAPDGKCRLAIAQNLLISVPVSFGATVVCEPGDVYSGPAATAVPDSAEADAPPEAAEAGVEPALPEAQPTPAETETEPSPNETDAPSAAAEAEAGPAQSETDAPPTPVEAEAQPALAGADTPPAAAETPTPPPLDEGETLPGPVEAAPDHQEAPAAPNPPEEEGTRSV